ncbi:hypothetical protein [Catenovulum sediminis]|uniref:CRISPR type III-B/RAMP module-associated protein Cmr5 n=1 Tax=Catenovulum sediminis TaxID=1740262 RepID=A0ABV1RBZ0_9ALTE|nr:hypothetical protein [Catenovulum sediminis]
MQEQLAEYQFHQLNSEPPINRLLRLLNIGIFASQNKQQERIVKVILLLNRSLESEKWPELADNLSKLYSHLLYLTEQQQYDEIQRIFLRLYNQWQKTTITNK